MIFSTLMIGCALVHCNANNGSEVRRATIFLNHKSNFHYKYYAVVRNRTVIFCNDIPAPLTSKNFYHSGVSVKIRPHAIIA
ncbi:hypothetical protein PUN28_008439 [Cardiocondyla obscurior]|uniref:Uncharacterized protein n=1 Tax=Cardiocondyla obscurior TaxID=286306 RepID=A0AAW2G2P5_9HYME